VDIFGDQFLKKYKLVLFLSNELSLPPLKYFAHSGIPWQIDVNISSFQRAMGLFFKGVLCKYPLI
jgi:hypothetical protein